MRWMIWLAVLAACSPYDPSLPHEPFLCGNQEPRCPDGYTCVADGDRMVCSDAPAEPDAGVDATALTVDVTP